jgi:hypothetical protein
MGLDQEGQPGQESRDSQAPAPPQKIDFEGKSYTPDELREALSKADDYTGKTQKLADERREFEQRQRDLDLRTREWDHRMRSGPSTPKAEPAGPGPREKALLEQGYDAKDATVALARENDQMGDRLDRLESGQTQFTQASQDQDTIRQFEGNLERLFTENKIPEAHRDHYARTLVHDPETTLENMGEKFQTLHKFIGGVATGGREQLTQEIRTSPAARAPSGFETQPRPPKPKKGQTADELFDEGDVQAELGGRMRELDEFAGQRR